MAINPFTGARLDTTFFDVNRDGQFTSADEMTLGGSSTGQQAVVTGLSTGESLNDFVSTGQYMQFQSHTSELDRLKFQVPATGAGRMSWREIVN